MHLKYLLHVSKNLLLIWLFRSLKTDINVSYEGSSLIKDFSFYVNVDESNKYTAQKMNWNWTLPLNCTNYPKSNWQVSYAESWIYSGNWYYSLTSFKTALSLFFPS